MMVWMLDRVKKFRPVKAKTTTISEQEDGRPVPPGGIEAPCAITPCSRILHPFGGAGQRTG